MQHWLLPIRLKTELTSLKIFVVDVLLAPPVTRVKLVMDVKFSTMTSDYAGQNALVIFQRVSVMELSRMRDGVII